MSNDKIYVIAEMACSHEGDLKLGKGIIDGACKAGADAIQFQIWKLDELMIPEHKSWDFLKKIEFTYEQWQCLYNYAKERNSEVEIIACVYEVSSVIFSEKMGVDAYKVHRSDLTNYQLIRAVAETGKRIDLSVGAATVDEITQAISWINEISSAKIWLMYGYQNFPTPIDDVHLDYILKLGKHFGLPVGYQDHTDGDSKGAYWLPAVAVSKGISIIEKHITHDRTYKGVDHEAALNPAEFIEFVKIMHEANCVDGDSRFPRPFSKEEELYRTYGMKSIVAARDLQCGHKLQPSDILFLRANQLGLSPDKQSNVLGKEIKENISAHSIIDEEVFV
jgi:N,N'-diacetyllegionaminate synthase